MKTNLDTMVFRIAGVMILASLLLSQIHSGWWLLFTTFIGANMLQASFTGFCPLARLLALFGVKTGPAFNASRATNPQ